MEVPYPLSDAFLGKISFKLAHIWSPGDTYHLSFILYLDKTQVVQANPSAVASLLDKTQVVQANPSAVASLLALLSCLWVPRLLQYQHSVLPNSRGHTRSSLRM